MTNKYKRKFLVPGDTIKDCWDFRRKCRKKYGTMISQRPCTREVKRGRDESLCPFPINQPNKYIVSEMEDGTWRCSCPQWKFRRRICHHIEKAKTNPEKYEIAKEFTGKTTDVISKLFK